jgi:hypothetical protein
MVNLTKQQSAVLNKRVKVTRAWPANEKKYIAIIRFLQGQSSDQSTETKN